MNKLQAVLSFIRNNHDSLLEVNVSGKKVHYDICVPIEVTRNFFRGSVIAQAVSRWLPIAAARVRSKVKLCGISGGQSGSGAGFLRLLRFPLPVLIPLTASHSSSISGAGTIGQLVADVPSGLSLTPNQKTNKQKNQTLFWKEFITYNRPAIWNNYYAIKFLICIEELHKRSLYK
jgi:hypothetical protein